MTETLITVAWNAWLLLAIALPLWAVYGIIWMVVTGTKLPELPDCD